MSRKRVVLWVVSTIVGPLLFYWLTSACSVGMWYARTGHQGSPTPEIMIQGMFVGVPPALFAVVALWWWNHKKKATFAQFYLIRSNAIAADLAIGVVLGVLWVGVYGLLDVVSWRDVFTLGVAKLASVPASLSAGLCEEFLYRGFLFWLIAAAGGRNMSRLAIASIAFGLAHCFWGPWGDGVDHDSGLHPGSRCSMERQRLARGGCPHTIEPVYRTCAFLKRRSAAASLHRTDRPTSTERHTACRVRFRRPGHQFQR